MKYIIFENKTGLKYPIIFPDFIDHDAMQKIINQKAVSAGNCEFSNSSNIQKIRPYGGSISLGLETNLLEDCKLLNFGWGNNYE